MSTKQLPEEHKGAAIAPALIDINTADVETLSQLPRIGRVVANRIVEYRLRQPFRRPEELMNVPGIGAAVYRDLAERVTAVVGPPSAPTAVELEPVPPLDSPQPELIAEPEAELPPHSIEAMPLPLQEPLLAEASLPAPTPAESAPATSSDSMMQETIGEPTGQLSPPSAELPPTGPMPLPVAPPPVSVSRTEELLMTSPPMTRPSQASTRDWNGLIGMSLFGALLGMVFTLLLLAGINHGTLILNQQGEVATLSAQADDLSTRLTSLESTAKSLRTRLDTLEGLTGRVDEVEAALGKMSSNLDTLGTKVGDLNDRADALSASVEVVRATANRFDAFLSGLRNLLAESSATPSPTAVPTSSATPTPAPVP